MQKAIEIALSDSKVQAQLGDKEYGKEYIVSEIIPGYEALNRGLLRKEELPSPLVAIVAIDLGKPESQEIKLLVVVDLIDEKVTSLWQSTTRELVPSNPKVDLPRNGAKDVPVDTLISVSFWRGRASISETIELIMKPEVEIGQVIPEEFEEYGVAGVKLHFRPARPLLPETTYTAILSYRSGSACIVWQFTTEPYRSSDEKGQ